MYPDVWGAAAIASKFGLYIGILTSAGTVLAALVLLLERYRAVALQFAILGLVASVTSFALRGAQLTGDISGIVDVEMLALLWSTPVGTALMYRIAGLGLIVLGLALGYIGLWISVGGGLLAIWSFNNIGHIPDRDSVFLNLSLFVHLVAIALWIGILIPLKQLTTNSHNLRRAAVIAELFSVVALFTVPLLFVVGIILARTLVGSLTAVVTTGYGQVLMLKVVAFAVLLSLAAANKLRFTPALQRGEFYAAENLSVSISIEWGIVLVILAATAFMTTHLTLPI